MTQPATQSLAYDVGVLSRHVGTIADNEDLFQKEKTDQILELATSLGETLKGIGPQHDAKLAQLRETVKQMLGVRADVKAHVEALQDMRRQLQPDAEPTDFAAALDVATDEALQDRPDAEEDEVLQEFDAKVAAADGSGAAEPEDDELQIEDRGEIAPNAACPITGVGILEMENPVEDEMGFVYEKSGIEAHIRQTGVAGVVPCPNHGTTHMVSLRTLKKANHVIKAQKRKRRRDEQLSQHPNAGTGDVLDID